MNTEREVFFTTMRGYQRKIICLKKTDSPIIDEAYFVLSKDVSFDKGRGDFIKEANRIIEENTKKRRKKDGRLTAFLMGLICALSMAVSLFILTR